MISASALQLQSALNKLQATSKQQQWKSLNPQAGLNLQTARQTRSDEWRPVLTTSLYKNRRGKSSKQSWRNTTKELTSGLKQAQTMILK